MGISYAVWGAFFGWLLMPHLRQRSLQTFMPVVAYATALVGAALTAYSLDMHRQAWLFVIGMIGQFSLFVLAKVAAAYLGRKKKINE